jgi:hypothetical protein
MKQSPPRLGSDIATAHRPNVDCFVAALLAMTGS